MKGYAGKILRVNLSTRNITTEKLSEGLARKFLGGRGLGSWYLFKEIDPKVDPYSPDNKLIFATGPLTGSGAPTGSRYMAITKGPLTGTIACSNSGGFWGPELKKAGYDMLIVEGASEKPVYIYIKDGSVEIRDASHIWGKDTHETTDILLEECGEKGARVACIGPAGEKLVRFAAIINDRNRAAGRTGVGAVMGSKKLKAVVVKGSGSFEVYSSNFKDVCKDRSKKLMENPITGEGFPKLGTKILDSPINENGLYPTRNFQDLVFEATDSVCGEALVEKGYLVGTKSCFACPIGCGRVTRLPNGLEGEGPEYETAWAFGANCGVSDLIAISEANFICNRLGLDTISAGATIACAMELFERGIIDRKELGNGPELRFGNSEAIVYYAEKMGMREGFGDILAEGSYRMAQKYGHPEFAMTVKGQELPAYDPRGAQGQGLEYATSNRGGCHVRGYMIAPEILGVPEKLEPQETKGKAEFLKMIQDLTAVVDSSGLCLFTTIAFEPEDYLELVNAATGFGYTLEGMLEVGERIWNLERLFNLKAGIDPKEDTLPKRLLEEPAPSGPNKGCVVKLEEMLKEYYKVRGWTEKGEVPEEKAKSLGIL